MKIETSNTVQQYSEAIVRCVIRNEILTSNRSWRRCHQEERMTYLSADSRI